LTKRASALVSGAVIPQSARRDTPPPSLSERAVKTVLKVLLGVVLVLILLGAASYVWASGATEDARSRVVLTHEVTFPIPAPLSEEEVEEMGLAPDEAAVLAMERALERGRHLVEARYGCAECHGENFAGGVMMEAGPVATFRGPNLTLGEGGVTREYTPADWDRAVRHGVLPDGRLSAMPSEDFQLMSDQELGDIIAYIRSFPSVDNEVEAVSFGPIGKFLVATEAMGFSADRVANHAAPHPSEPPAAEVTVEFGRHLSGICTGCHKVDFAGGEIGGDPSWAPAANLTPHAEGLAGWSFEDFERALLEGVRPDGTELLSPMNLVMPFAAKMTPVEREALWLYLQSLPPLPTGS
jgi:mono/diheme cytochrome c family protein